MLKNITMTCNLEHRYDAKFNSLNESQEFFDEPERHKCAGCAYDQGFADAQAGKSSGIRLSELPQSQAGTVRHKDPLEAYNLGYGDGAKS